MSVEEIASSGIVPSQREMIDGRLSEWSLIYEGAYSLLYKAKRYGKWHIVKCLRAEFRGNELYENLLMKEFEVGVMLEHKNIGKTESYENDERFGNLIVKEYVDGVTLPNFLKGNVSKAERRRILDEILSAMSYWHSFQIVHRDLKPENVMITRNGSHVKVIDFGLSDTDSHAILKQPAGTEKYMSPEQKSGELAIDCRSDIYSFGMLLKDLFPSCYSNVCRKCTEQDREKRYGSANEIQRALDKTDKMKKFLLVLVPVFALVLIAVVFAGVMGVGFGVSASENAQKLQENVEKLHLTFERKMDRPTGYQIAPRYVSVSEIQARVGLTEKEILDAVNHDDHYRLINLAVTQNAEEHPQDKLAVEHYMLNTVYGQCIDRGSKVTIFSPSNIVDPIMGWWSYYLAKIGGFNYISRELGKTRPYLSFYSYKPELNIPGNAEFMADMNKLANSEDCWVFSLMPASGAQEPQYPTQFHFCYGAAKGDTTFRSPNITLNDTASFKRLYSTVSDMLAQTYGLSTDKQLYHNNDSPALFVRHLNHKTNAVSLRVAWSVVCWDMMAIQIARDLAAAINKEILHLEGNPEVSDLGVKDIGFDGYEN